MKWISVLALAAALEAVAVSEQTTLWKDGDGGVAKYRIPALCTATNGDLVAVCDARTRNGGDLNVYQPIYIVCRRSTDNGKSWSPSAATWAWPWNDTEQWSASDPSLIVDRQTGALFLFCNVWEWKRQKGIYQFFVQTSTDNGASWSKPRDITRAIAFEPWAFGGQREAGGFIFIPSGSGIQMRDGTLMHTLTRVGNPGEVALFGSPDHGASWKHYGVPAVGGDECKIVELDDGTWMINSRGRRGGREIHRSTDRGMTWHSTIDAALIDPQCNGQLIRYPLPVPMASGSSVLLFSNCKSPNRRHNLHIRRSADGGKSWSEGVCVEPLGAAYSDITILKDGGLGVLFEGAGYSTIRFCTLTADECLK